MSARAKFRVISKTVSETNGTSLSMTAVMDGSTENEDFFKWSPAGSLTLNTINDEVGKQFYLGDEVYVDLTKAAPFLKS